MMLKLAAARYTIGTPDSFAAFADRISTRVTTAVDAGARVIVLPEYLALELAAALPAHVHSDFVRSLTALQPFHGDYLALMRELARRHAVYLLAGTFLLATDTGRYRNRAYFVAPEGQVAFQDKLTLTGFEREAGVIEPGEALKVFDTTFGRIGIDICYDVEFPLYARAQAQAGARVLLVPSCTDTAAGAHRVKIGCQARTLENQIYAACAVTAGEAPWSPALDVNTGNAAIYTPIDHGFPADGIAARTTDADTDDWAITELDLAALDAFKRQAQVANANDWQAQLRPPVVHAHVEPL